jgi:hypothetical protein
LRELFSTLGRSGTKRISAWSFVAILKTDIAEIAMGLSKPPNGAKSRNQTMDRGKNLAGASVANRIMEQHDPSMAGGPHVDRPGPDQIIHIAHGMRFIGRFCTVKGERSGGYVIKAALDERYQHESGLIQWLETRLRPGWKHAALTRACSRFYVELSKLRTLKRHREQVYTLAESRDIDLDRIDKIAEGEGREIVYSAMTMADCEFWKIELAKYPEKAA